MAHAILWENINMNFLDLTRAQMDESFKEKNMERPRFKAGMGRNNFLAREEKEPEACSDYS